MLQKFVSMFKNLSHREKNRGHVKKPETESDSCDSENEDIDLYSSNILSLVTRNGPMILKIHAIFEKIFESDVPVQANAFECITGCGKARNTVLYASLQRMLVLIKNVRIKKNEKFVF